MAHKQQSVVERVSVGLAFWIIVSKFVGISINESDNDKTR